MAAEGMVAPYIFVERLVQSTWKTDRGVEIFSRENVFLFTIGSDEDVGSSPSSRWFALVNQKITIDPLAREHGMDL